MHFAKNTNYTSDNDLLHDVRVIVSVSIKRVF